MTDIATLVLAVDSTQVKTGAASLDGLTAAGVRAEAAAVGVASASKGAAAAAAQMATQAQVGAAAAVHGAGALNSFGASANNSRVVALELAHVTRSMAEQMAMGVSPVRALTMEMARLATAAQYAGGIGGLFRAIGSFVLPVVAPLAAVAAAAGLAFGAFKQFQTQVKDSGELTRFRDNLGLTHKEMLQLSDGVDKAGGKIKELTDVTVTAGDVMSGVWKAIKDGAALTDAGKGWASFKAQAAAAFGAIIDAWAATSAGITAGIYGTYDAVKMVWGNFPRVFGDLFVQGVNLALTALNKLVQAGTDGINALISGANSVLGMNIGKLSAPQLGLLDNPNAGAAAKAVAGIGHVFQDEYAKAKKADSAFWDQVKHNAIQNAKDRMKDQADALIADRTPKKAKKQSDHGLADALAELDAQIKGQLALAAAYQISDAAAIKAEAMQKAEEQAIRHKGEVGIFYEKELALAVATRAAEGGKTIANLRFEADARQRVNDMVAAGIIPASQSNVQLQLETTLRPLVAAAAVAEGDVKQKILDIIKALTKAYAENNDQIARGNALQQIAANDNDIAKLQLENSLIGASNRERAVAIAQLETMQKIRDENITDPAQQATLLQQATQKATLAAQSPFQQWAASIPQTAAAVNEALQSIQVRGFDNLASSIADVVTGAKSLKSAFKDVAKSIISDIVQMTVRMLIFRALSSVFGGLGGGGGFDSGSFAQTVSSNNAALGIPHLAGGGIFPVGGNGGGDSNLLSINGVPRAMVGANENVAVLPRGRGGQGGGNAPQQIEITIGFGDAPDFAPYVQEVAAKTTAAGIRQAAPVLVKAAVNQTMRAASRPRLMRGR